MLRSALLAAALFVCCAVSAVVAPHTSSAESNASGPAEAGSDGSGNQLTAADRFRQYVVPFVRAHCAACHSGSEPAGSLNLAAYESLAQLAANRSTWEKLLQYVREGVMPPAEAEPPAAAERQQFVEHLNEILFGVDCNLPRQPGRVTLRRLNRVEYNNTIRDLVGIDFAPAADFPSDDVGYGFDNIGDVLTLPPLLLEKYLAAAEEVMRRAIVTEETLQPVASLAGSELARSGGVRRQRAFAGMYSNGTVTADVVFPADGEYRVRIVAYGDQAGGEPPHMSIRLNDEEVGAADVAAVAGDPQPYEVVVRAPAGPQRVSAAFTNDYYRPDDPDPNNRDRNLIIVRLEVLPMALPGELPPAHRAIFICSPESEGGAAAAARKILQKFASRAYRRPVRPEELDRLVRLFDQAQSAGDTFERAIQVACTAVLCSPNFLFLVERDPEPGQTSRALGDYELASRLSYFLWSSMPDDVLLALAQEGVLVRPDVLAAQAKRMLAEARSAALVENFATQWLTIRRLELVAPDSKQFPSFDEELRRAMYQESVLFFSDVVQNDRSVLDLLDADYTFLNERLARHYGIDGVNGPEFRRVALPDRRRGGVLTQASVLTVTSNPTRTSPVKRGKWILEQLLGTPPPPPPAAVEPLAEGPTTDGTTLRQRMEQHRANPNCAVCHAKLDPLGFGLENYDPIGAWRSEDGGQPIDSSGELPDGSRFSGPEQLKDWLLARQDDFVRAFAEKLLTYALGRGLEPYDRCTVDDVVAAARADGYRFSSFVLAIVASDAFRRRAAAEEP